MALLKKHVDTVVVLGGVFGCFLWINSSLKEVDQKLITMDKRLTVIETVLVMKNIMSPELNCKADKSVALNN